MRAFLFSTLSAMVLLPVLFFAGCQKRDNDTRPAISCGLPPTAYLAGRICGDKFKVTSLLPEGRNPHDYSPTPREIREAARSKCFFSTGMTFERKAAEALKRSSNVVNVTAGIKRRHLEGGHQCSDDHSHGDEDLDPHVWLSTVNAEKMAANILDEVIKLDPANADYYRQNFAALQKELLQARENIRTTLAPFAGRHFFVYHPSFGYFADESGMVQQPVEINGRDLKPQQYSAVIARARKENVRVIFVQPQFKPGQAEKLAKDINGTVQILDPLSFDLMKNFQILPEAIKSGFSGGGVK